MAVVFLGYKPDGKMDRRYFYADTPDQALTKRDVFLESHRAGFTPPTGKGDTVGEHLVHWLYHVIRPKVRATTWHQSYKPKILNHLVPRLGRPRLKDLSEEDVERFLTDMKDDGYSPAQILACFRLLSQALKHAVRRKLIGRNVCDFVDPPRQDAEEPLPPERDEAAVLLEALERRRNGVRWQTALAVGPRRGETLGLAWPCVDLTDLDAATIRIAWELVRLPWQHGCEDVAACTERHHVRACPPDCTKGTRLQGGRPHQCRTKVCLPGCAGEHQGRCIKRFCPPDCDRHAKACPDKRDGGLVMTEPKSKKSRRTVVVPRPLAERLLLHQMAQAAEREQPGWVGWGHEPRTPDNPDGCERRPRPREVVCPRCQKPIKKDALVFTQPNGLPINPAEDWREWAALLAELGLPHYRPHDARHFSVTLQLEEGVDPRVVSDNHGHTSVSFTKERYQHVTQRQESEAAKKVGGALWPSAPRPDDSSR
ncbi:tyrosine-type recombinase/integrase [Nonomuraea polychroma]|uniref:tyrosine-type recombinase/integrase n=1 Tax=Nonomuraea polychroma TaxID=46176 RepID=UPI003D937348